MGAEHVDIEVPQGRGVEGGLLGLRPDPNSAASSAHPPGAADDVFYRGFALFTGEKSAALIPHSGSELSADFTSWTPAAYGVPMVPEPVLEVESEGQYLTDGWMISADGGTGRRSILGGGSCMTPLRRVAVEFLPVVVSRQGPGLFSAEHEVLLHASVHGGSWNFCILHALFTLGNMVHYFLLAWCLAVTCPVSGCCMRNTEHEFSVGYSRNAWLDSEYMFCISMRRF